MQDYERLSIAANCVFSRHAPTHMDVAEVEAVAAEAEEVLVEAAAARRLARGVEEAVAKRGVVAAAEEGVGRKVVDYDKKWQRRQ